MQANRRGGLTLAIVAVLLASGALGMVSEVAVAATEPLILAAGQTALPRTDGAVVAWVRYPDGPTGQGDVEATRLADRQTISIADGPLNQLYPDVAGDVVIWAQEDRSAPCDGCPFDVRGMRLSTGESFDIATGPADQTLPIIGGDWVVWIENDGKRITLAGRDISVMNPPTTLAVIDGTFTGRPATDGTRVVWVEEQPYGLKDTQWQLRAVTLASGDTTTLASGIGSGPYGVDIADDLVVYTGSVGVAALNVVTGVTIDVPGKTGQFPTTDGRYIFWQDFRNYSDARHVFDLWGYDTGTQSAFPVSVGAGQVIFSEVRNGLLVWQRTEGDSGTINALPLAGALPSAARPAPGAADLNVRWFPETGHTLIYGFKGYWDANGGLSVFGYPLTEEFSERAAATGDDYTVQYFERQRFEWHPEYQGTPYQVELGRLGSEDAVARGLLTTPPFLPIADAGDPNCEFFWVTGHTLCGAFRDYWRSHGLDLGDAGVSERESLALFGYPLSEPYTDPATGLTIQYFERAVFEYHPENVGTLYVVLLRRLGAEALAARGW